LEAVETAFARELRTTGLKAGVNENALGAVTLRERDGSQVGSRHNLSSPKIDISVATGLWPVI
jgi:hypothetical protein